MYLPSVIPTVEIIGPKGRLVVNKDDLDTWRKKGYRLLTEPEHKEAFPIASPSSPPLPKKIVPITKQVKG